MQTAENSLEVIFVTKYQKKNLKKKLILIEVVQKRLKSNKTCSETTITAKQHKN